MMLSISPLMTLIALVTLPVSAVLVMVAVKRSQKYFVAQQEYLGHVNGQIEEVFGGHNVIKLFNKEESALKEFEEKNDILYQSAWKSQFLSGLMQPLMNFVGNLGYGGCSSSRRIPEYQRNDRGRRYPIVYPVRKTVYSAGITARAGIQYAAVYDGVRRTCICIFR